MKECLVSLYISLTEKNMPDEKISEPLDFWGLRVEGVTKKSYQDEADRQFKLTNNRNITATSLAREILNNAAKKFPKHK